MPGVRRMGGFPQPWPSVRPRGAATASSRRLAPTKFDCAASLIFQIEKRPLRGISALQPGAPVTSALVLLGAVSLTLVAAYQWAGRLGLLNVVGNGQVRALSTALAIMLWLVWFFG
jgi:hypothetical protein